MDPLLIILVAGSAALVLIIIGVLIESSNKDSSPRQRSSSGGSKAPALLLGFIVLLVAGGVVAYFILVEQEKRDIEKKFGSKIATMCDNPSGTAGLDNLPAATRPFKVVALEGDGTRHVWHSNLPEDVRAVDQATTNIVACVGKEQEEVIESCPYQSLIDGNQITITVQRIRLYVDVLLLNPDTGLPITTVKVVGAEPGACPEVAVGKEKIQKQPGGKPDEAAFIAEMDRIIR